MGRPKNSEKYSIQTLTEKQKELVGMALDEMKKRNIKVCGGIDEEYGKTVLQYYVDIGKTIYKPTH